MKIPPRLKPTFFRLMALYPPFIGAGIRIKHVAEDLLTFDVEMKLTPLNQNYVGTQFGGSLYSMCDPFYMIMLKEGLGRGFIVWDQSAIIRFRRPGRGKVHARFAISQAELDDIRSRAIRDKKISPIFKASVLDDQGQLIAEVEKTLYVRHGAR